MSKVNATNGNNLMAVCLRGCSWVGLGSLSAQILRMLRLWFLTYLLAPGDLGILTLVWCVFALLQELSDTGIKHALIQNPNGHNRHYLDNAWLLNLMRNVLLYGILYLTAPYIANGLYQKPELQQVLRLAGTIFLLDAFTSVSLILLQKQLQFKRITLVTLAGNAANLLATVLFLLHGQEIRGAVFGEIIGAFTIWALSYFIHPYRPRLHWHRIAGKELLGYGVMVYLATLLDAFGLRLDILILGFIAANQDVGIYGLGMAAVMAPCSILSLLIVSVGFPALSLVQHNRQAVRRGAAEITKAVQSLAGPLFALLFLLGPDLVKILPIKYAPTGVVIRWLSLYGFTVVSLRQISPALYAIRKVHWFVLRGLLNILLQAVLIIPLYRKYGLAGACWAANITFLITTVLIWAVALRELRWSWRQWIQDTAGILWAWLAGGLCFAAACLVLHHMRYPWSAHLPARLLATLLGLLTYAAGYYRYYYRNTRIPPLAPAADDALLPARELE